MAQAWFSVWGLSLDILGFGLIVREWRVATATIRVARLEDGMKWLEDAIGRGPAQRFTAADRKGHENLLNKWRRQLANDRNLVHAGNLREHLFLFGATLVFAGFVLQIIGSFPTGMPLLGARP